MKIRVSWNVKFRVALITLGTVKGSADVSLPPALNSVFGHIPVGIWDGVLFHIDTRGVRIEAKLIK